MSAAVRRRRTALKGELGGELAALLDAGRKLRGELEAPPLRPGELPRLPEPRVPSYHLTGERARLAREADYRRGLRREAIGERVQLEKQRRASTRATDVATLEAEAFKEERKHVKDFLEDFEAGSYEHHAHAPRVTDRELAREAERYHMERELELAERAGELGQALEDLDDEQAAELLAELDDDDPPF